MAYELGVRYFDGAPSYGAGLAEREIGRLARDRRSTLVLATKFGIVPDRIASVLPAGAYLGAATGMALKTLGLRRAGSHAPRRNYSGLALKESVNGSLRRLRSDYIDILYLHAPTLEWLGDVEGLLEAFDALRRAGKVRWVGLSGDASQCLAIARSHPPLAEILQIEVPAAPDGLPVAAALPSSTAIGFWEFPATPYPEGKLDRVLERLQEALPEGVVLLSTPSTATVRRALDFFSSIESDRPGEAAPQAFRI